MTTKYFDMTGEESFGLVTSWLYSHFSNSFLCKSLYRFVADDIAKSRARKILDVGTGPAAIPIMLAEKSRRLQIYAVDPSHHMLKIAEKRAKGRKIHLGYGYSMRIPFKTKFDIIFTSVSFHHWAHKKESLRYLSKFLNKKGEIRIYEFRKIRHLLIQEKHSMTREELRDALTGTGLKLKEIIEHNRMFRASYMRA